MEHKSNSRINEFYMPHVHPDIYQVNHSDRHKVPTDEEIELVLREVQELYESTHPN